MDKYWQGVVKGRKGSTFENAAGQIVGGGDRCKLEGCLGVRISVRWPDGHLTRPCSKGLTEESANVFRID